MIENHIASCSVKPYLGRGRRSTRKRIAHYAHNGTYDQKGSGENLFDFIKHK